MSSRSEHECDSGDHLAPARPPEARDDARLNHLMEILLRVCNLDFSVRADVGSTGDVYDALSAGLNVVCEELATHNSARLRLEGELRGARDRLEAQVQERTLELVEANRQRDQRIEELSRTNALLRIEMEERARLSAELLQSQKLCSIGQLAAGIAHELNTPMQYVVDNVHFIEDATTKNLLPALRACRRLLGGHTPDEDTAAARAALDGIDREGLEADLPTAFVNTVEGLRRMTTIVSAMRAFAHPSGSKKTVFSLREAIENTAMVARNEWKYVADLTVDIDESLAPVLGLRDELNQVWLNLIVNAAHAVEERYRGTGEHGHIRVAACAVDGATEVTISDDGCGIPANIQHRVFDQFFTTKGVGKGTGQGLAIAWAVVQRHGGTMSLKSEVGQGTAFVIRLPHAEATAAA